MFWPIYYSLNLPSDTLVEHKALIKLQLSPIWMTERYSLIYWNLVQTQWTQNTHLIVILVGHEKVEFERKKGNT